MSEPKSSAVDTSGFAADPGNLAARTLRTVVLLVAACVLFVGTLSAAAMFLSSKAASASSTGSSVAETRDTGTKKPLSI